MATRLDGSGSQVLADNLGLPNAMAIDEAFVYWTDPEINLGYPLSGGTVEKVAKPR